jgi:hypothetical protein
MGIFDADYPAVKFERIGDTFTGRITEPYTVRDATEFGSTRPKLDSRGQVVQMAVITVEDINTKEAMTIFADKFPLRKAIGEAYRAAGASDLEVGGILTVTFTHETPSDKGNPAKGFQATYVRPGTNEVFGGGAPATDAVGGARAVQQAAQAAHQQPQLPYQKQAPAASAPVAQASAPPAAPATTNGSANMADDMRMVKNLAKANLTPAQIVAALDDRYTIDAVTAILAIPA